MVETLTTLSTTAVTFHEEKLLRRAKQAQIVYKLGQIKPLKGRSGNTIEWRRVNTLAVNTTALTEGVTPTGTSLSMTAVTATVSQYGDFVAISDMLDLMGIDPLISEAVEVFGQQAGESVETLIFDVTKAGSSVKYATGASRTAQAATNILTVDMIRKAVTTLDVNNTRRFGGPEENDKVGQGEYICLIHPYVASDLKRDTEWKTHVQNTQAYNKLYNGEIGMIEGCRILQSTLVPVFTAGGLSSANVYATLFFGQQAFGVVDVAGGGEFKVYAKQLGSAGSADPLDQRATVGWKANHVAKILNNNFLVRYETGATGG